MHMYKYFNYKVQTETILIKCDKNGCTTKQSIPKDICSGISLILSRLLPSICPLLCIFSPIALHYWTHDFVPSASLTFFLPYIYVSQSQFYYKTRNKWKNKIK